MTAEQIQAWNLKNKKVSNNLTSDFVLKSDLETVAKSIVFMQDYKEPKYANCYIGCETVEIADKILNVIDSLEFFDADNEPVTPSYTLFSGTLSLSIYLIKKVKSGITARVKQ